MSKIIIDNFELAYQSWGEESNPNKLVCFHGWLDNSNSFLPLSKHLEKDFHVLAFDLPGHGYSSHLSSASHYHFTDSLFVFEALRREMKIEKFNFLSHSLGGVLSGLYAGVFPQHVKQIFSIEALGPIPNLASDTADALHTYIDRRLQFSKKKKKGHPSIESCIDARARDGRLAREHCKTLVDRGVYEEDGKYYWLSDQRLVLPTSVRFTEEQSKNVLEKIECPYHLILGDEGFSILQKAISQRKSYIKNFHMHSLKGGHHLHMEDPVAVAKIVIDGFI